MLTTRTTRSAAAAASVVALALGLAACGSDEGATSGGLSTAASASTANAAGKTGEQGKDGASEEAKASEVEKSGEAKDASGEAAPPSLENPLEDPNMTVPSHEPLQGGTPGADSDREEMQRTVHAAMNPGSYEKWTRALMENSCRKVTDPIQAELDRMGMTLDQVEQTARMQQEAGEAIEMPATEVTLDDVRIEGNRASASVTATNVNGTETQTQIFEREDGRWKLCN